ncbi:metallophosphoesterase, partial [Halarcobacter sp.]|uniref:metallophosphoesterase n=1 Tax=Halarcobacter sp. TaxID=2321133 RepID=UPI003A95BADA
FEGHQSLISSLVKIDEKTIVSGSYDETIRVWDIEKKEQIAVFEGHQSSVTSLIKIDERTIASGSYDNTIRVWDIEKKEQIVVFDKNASKIYFENSHLFIKGFQNNIDIFLLDENWTLKDTKKAYTTLSSISSFVFEDGFLMFSTASGNLYVEPFDFDELTIINKEYTNHYHIKTLLLGDSGVGKTTTAYSLEYSDYNKEIHSTHGMRFFNFTFDEKFTFKTSKRGFDHHVSFDIWDFGGQPEYQISHKQNFDNTRVIFLVIDLKREDNSVYFWLNSIKEHLSKVNKEQLSIYIIGTKKAKTDDTEKRLSSIKDIFVENLKSSGVEKENIHYLHHHLESFKTANKLKECELLNKMKEYVKNRFKPNSDTFISSVDYEAVNWIKEQQNKEFYFSLDALRDELENTYIKETNINTAISQLKKDGRIEVLGEKYVILKPYWKNLFSTAILRHAQNNKYVFSSISLQDLFFNSFDVSFDKLIDKEKGIKIEDEKLHKKIFDKDTIKDDMQVLFMKEIISNFFKDKICYYNNGMLTFPSRFIDKKDEFNKKDYFEIDSLNLVSQKYVEETIGTIVSCLNYSNEYKVLKYLSKGIKLKKVGAKEIYLIEFSRDDLISQKRNQHSTFIKVYAKQDSKENKKLIRFLELILEKHLKKIYQKKKYQIFKKDNNQVKKESLGFMELVIKPKYKNIIQDCLDKEKLSFEEKECDTVEFDKRELYQIDENIEKSVKEVFKKYDKWKIQKDDNKRNILHLSDLHFDENINIKKEIILLKENLRLGEFNRNEVENRIDYIVLSGDLSAKGTPKEFMLIYDFISKLIELCNIDAQRVFIVPGNHDYSRDETHKAYGIRNFRGGDFKDGVDYKIDDRIYLKRDFSKWNKRFENFSEYLYESLYKESFDFEKSLKLIQNEEFSFVLINTSLEIDHFNPTKVIFDTDAFITVQDEVKKNNIKFVVGHHPIEYEKSYSFVNNLHQFNYKAYIHGHVHRNNLISFNDIIVGKKEKLTYIGSGLFYSASSRSQIPGVPFMFNIVTYDKNEKKLFIDTREREETGMNWRPSSLYPQSDGSFGNIYEEQK